MVDGACKISSINQSINQCIIGNTLVIKLVVHGNEYISCIVIVSKCGIMQYAEVTDHGPDLPY